MSEAQKRARRSGIFGVLMLSLFVPTIGAASTPPATTNPASGQSKVVATMMKAPLSFEANQGQTDKSVNFIARGSGYTLFLTPTESVMVLQQREAKEQGIDKTASDPLSMMEPAPIKQSVIRMKLEGANPSPAIDGMEQLPGVVNYFIGNDPDKWRTKIPTYARVQYTEAYPGIDLAYYGNQGKLEYDFIVSPGADPNQIKLAFEGASDIKVANSGDLLLTTALGDVRLQKPVVYQYEEDGRKTFVSGNYIASLQDTRSVGIEVALYDHKKPVIIDSVLIYSSFIGGTGTDEVTDIAVDPSGNAWVAGTTAGLTLPITGTPYDSSFNGFFDVFVLRVSPSGTLLVWSYLGSSGNDHTPSITLDGAGNVWLTGTTGGAFPITPGNLQAVYQGGGDAFITKLDPAGSTLLYSTLYGTSASEVGRSLAVDTGGSTVYLGGITTALALPGSGGPVIQPNLGGGQDGFIAKINVISSHVDYVTYLGGTGREDLNKVKLDAAGNLHVIGQTFSTDFPGTALSAISALAGVQPSFGGGTSDAFAVKLNASGTQLLYSTYLGGNDADAGLALVLDSTGNALVSGNTRSPNFPLAGTPFQTTRVGNDYFALKINQGGTALMFSTYFGGIGNDSGGVVALDQSDNVYLSGQSNSCRVPPFPHPLQIDHCLAATNLHIFVGQLDPTGSSLLSLFVFLGTGSGIANGLATDGNGNLYVAGFTRASDFTTLNAFQGTFAGSTSDAFIAKISYKPTANAGPDQSVPMGTVVTLDGTGSSGGSLTYSWTQVVGGPTVGLTGATTFHPTFTAPTVLAAGGNVAFDLVVCEGTSSNCSDPDTVNVHITNMNRPPVAEAGLDQTVQEGSPVMLDGTASYDPDVEALTYQWTQTLGPAVTLLGGNTATPTFAAPSVGPAGETIVFDLTVTDARTLTGSDSISVLVSNVNQSPTANAGPDQTKNELTLVTLDGSGSIDPDLDALNYTWTQTGGLSVMLTGANTPSPTFTAPNVGVGGTLLTFDLVVNDGQVSSAADSVKIMIQNVNDPPVCTLAQASPDLLWPPNHTMVPVTILGITDPRNQSVTITFGAVTQDEPVNGLGDGDTSPDAAESGNQILLRAERAGTGNGRVYKVPFTAANTDGASCSGTVRVSVPHSKKDPAVEGAQIYNSFGP